MGVCVWFSFWKWSKSWEQLKKTRRFSTKKMSRFEVSKSSWYYGKAIQRRSKASHFMNGCRTFNGEGWLLAWLNIRKTHDSGGCCSGFSPVHVYCIVPRCSVTLAPPPWKQIGRCESNKPIKSKFTHRQSINQSINQQKGLQWKSTLDWLIQSAVGKIAPRGWFPGGSKKRPETAGQYSILLIA